MTSASARDEGIRLLKEGSVAESIDFLLQAISEDPSDLEAHMYLGWAYARLEQHDKAVEILERALDLAPTNPKVHYNLGVAYQRAHNITEAKNEYLKALSLDPTYTAAKQALDFLTRGGTDNSQSS
jgi:Flp pilus assembly protein TadD